MGNLLRIAKWGNPGTPDKPNARWRQENLVTVEFPFQMRNAYVSGGKVNRCSFHRKGAMRLLQALNGILAAARDEVKQSEEWATRRIRLKKSYGYDRGTEFYDVLMKDWVDEQALKLIRDCGGDIWGGSFVLRYVRGYEKKRILSPHAFGTAVDMDPKNHPLGKRNTGWPRWYLMAWRDAGWTWGGSFRSRGDEMHWEL